MPYKRKHTWFWHFLEVARHLQEARQNLPLVLQGQPFALAPSFLEQTPLHLQLDCTAAEHGTEEAESWIERESSKTLHFDLVETNRQHARKRFD